MNAKLRKLLRRVARKCGYTVAEYREIESGILALNKIGRGKLKELLALELTLTRQNVTKEEK